jgi:hypothetical protein
MKLRYVFALLGAFTVFGNTASAGERTFVTEPIADVDAQYHIGQNRVICGDVKRVNLKKYGAFIDMGGFQTLPNGRVVLSPSFTAIIWENDRIKLEIDPNSEFLGNFVCFSGVISSSPKNRYTTKSVPQITIRNLEQIQIKP